MTGNEPTQPSAQTVPKSEPSIPVRKLVLGLVGVVVAVAVGWFGWSQYTTHQRAEKVKELNWQVKQVLQEQLDSKPENAAVGIRIDDVSLIRESDTKYSGIVSMHSARVSQRQIPIDVSTDGSQIIWNMGDGREAFLSLLG